MKQALLLYNPVSGDRFVPKHLDEILGTFYEKGVQVFAYRLPQDESIDIDFLKSMKFDYVIAAGGDGTLRSIAQMLLENGIDKTYITLGAGTCNNFTTNIDMDKNLIDAIDELTNGSPQRVDVGCVNGKEYFLSSLAGGAFVTTSFSTDSSLKATLGPLAYYIKPLSELKNLKSFPVTIKTEETEVTENVYLFMILNGKSVGNFTNFLKEGDISDGKMEMILIKEGGAVETANLFLTILKQEDITHSPQVIYLKSSYFEISSSQEVLLSLDGEEGPSLPVSVSVVGNALNVLVP